MPFGGCYLTDFAVIVSWGGFNTHFSLVFLKLCHLLPYVFVTVKYFLLWVFVAALTDIDVGQIQVKYEITEVTAFQDLQAGRMPGLNLEKIFQLQMKPQL